MEKTKKSSPNSKNYNRHRIRRFEDQIVEVKGIVDRIIDPTIVILKNVCVNNKQINHITLILKKPETFSKNQRIHRFAVVEAYYRKNNTKSYHLRQI